MNRFGTDCTLYVDSTIMNNWLNERTYNLYKIFNRYHYSEQKSHNIDHASRLGNI